MMAGSDSFRIVVRGKQTHGARPWLGVDPIVTASQIVLGLQTIVSRQLDVSSYPAILTIGMFNSGVRNNIIPDKAELVGTFRTFDAKAREEVIVRIKRIATQIAESAGATAEFSLGSHPNPVVVNDPTLTARVLPSLQRAVGAGNVVGHPVHDDIRGLRAFRTTCAELLLPRRRHACGQRHQGGAQQSLARILHGRSCTACRLALDAGHCARLPAGRGLDSRQLIGGRHHCGPHRARNAKRRGRIRRLPARRVPARTRSARAAA